MSELEDVMKKTHWGLDDGGTLTSAPKKDKNYTLHLIIKDERGEELKTICGTIHESMVDGILNSVGNACGKYPYEPKVTSPEDNYEELRDVCCSLMGMTPDEFDEEAKAMIKERTI